jgi:phosphatidylinositol alpha-1,6-mannosyltransferase
MGKLGWLFGPLLWLYRPLDRYLARQAGKVLVNGEYGRQLICETYGLDSTIITHGAELKLTANIEQQVAQLRERYGIASKSLILTVNHLHPRKRIELLLQAMPAILARYPQTLALIVGQGAEEANLRSLAAQLGLADKVIFAGFVPDEELAAYYAAADVYAHTGRAESFGLSVLEASAAGLPVVAVNEGGPREIVVEAETGFLVEATPAALAEKIIRLLADPQLARRMGQAGQTRVQTRYTWEQGARDFEQAVKVLI